MTTFKQRLAEGFLFTDMYQLTMAQLYYRQGLHEKTAQFNHFFRDYPNYGYHKAGYCINAGLGWLLEWMQEARVSDADIAVLRAQQGRDGKRLFEEDFLTWLRLHGHYEGVSMRAIPEGRVVHPHIPLTVIEGPLAITQILETSLLSHLNYQILIATKAARIKESVRGSTVLEFGARRAHDMGANAGARAALIGGADFTSNVGISHALGYPPKGTHAHAMIQTFMALGHSELDAFRAYSEQYPSECLLLVDTIDTLKSGVPHAITVFEELRTRGHEPVGIRIDSGDLASVSIQAAKLLNEAGFTQCSIVLSNDLDELVIWQIATQITEEAPIYGVDPQQLLKRLVYGVGTRLITSQGDSALGGVYKLVGIRGGQEPLWQPAIKLSSPEKTPNPGDKAVYRSYDIHGYAHTDIIALVSENPSGLCDNPEHSTDMRRMHKLKADEISRLEPLLVEVMREGELCYDLPNIEQMRTQRKQDLQVLNPGVKRIVNPHIYPVSLSHGLWQLKNELIQRYHAVSE